MDSQQAGKTNSSGVALILVMLAMLILSVLSAAIVFTARSETLASNSFRVNTQADYLAKAGIQQAVNWFRSSHYQGISEANASTSYCVTSGGAPYYLYTADTQPVQLRGASCPNPGRPVQLIGYGSETSNYPAINNTESSPRLVATAFNTDLVNVRVTGDAGNSGTFSINAYLIGFQTVNQGVTPPYTRVTMEKWRITSKATWTGSSSSNGALATAEEEAILQPIYAPNWGNAMYAYCDITMSGTQGTCVDAFNSALGQYAGGNISVATGNCDQTTNFNVINSGATIGANGGVSLTTNISVAGNVIIGSNPTPGCVVPSPPFSGTSNNVLGQVVNGSNVPPNPVPTFRAGFPPALDFGTATLPTGASWPTMPPFPGIPTSPASNSPPVLNSYGTAINSPCMDATCDGTAAHPYELRDITLNASKVLQLVGGPDIFHPVVYDMASLSESGSSVIHVSGYVVINVQGSISITGNGISNGISGTIDISPAAVSLNTACTGNCVSIGGNGAVSALLNAPLANVTLGGGGANGYFVGAVQANNISVSGGYPVHYDVQLGGRNLGGTISAPLATAYSRKKM
jgi:Tfp pilus assembly protein PilV